MRGASRANPLGSPEGFAAFVAAVEEGSLQGAAEALDLTQSAMTKRIKSLERRVGVRLLDRHRHGVHPSTAGLVLYPTREAALATLAAAEAALAAHRGDVACTVRLSASYTVGEVLLPDWLSAFRHDRPDVGGRIEIVNSPAVLRSVREDRCDIGFTEGTDPLDGLVALTVARDALAVVVASGHRWAGRVDLAPDELSDEPYLARESGSGTRAVAASALAGAGVYLRSDLELASTESVKRALAGGGFALMSRLSVDAEIRAGTLHALPVRDVNLTRDLCAVRRDGPVASAAAAAFWTWLDTAPRG